MSCKNSESGALSTACSSISKVERARTLGDPQLRGGRNEWAARAKT
jgi:hypothetical protein